MNKSLLFLACLIGVIFAQQNIQDLVNVALNYTDDVDVAVIKHGSDGVQVTSTGTNADDLVLHLHSVDLAGNEGEWFVEWVNDEGQVWDVVDDGNGYFTVNGPDSHQEYYVPAGEWVEGVPQSAVSGIVDGLTEAVVNYVQGAGGEADFTVAQATEIATGSTIDVVTKATASITTINVAVPGGGR